MAKIKVNIKNGNLKNNVISRYTVNLILTNGVLASNLTDDTALITPPPVSTPCELQLDFSCPDNSQYIGAI